MVTKIYKSTLSVVCDFHFPRIFCFLNPSRLACSDNIKVSRRISKYTRKIMVAVLNPFLSTFCIMVSARIRLLKPVSRALEATSFCSCGFVKFCFHFSHKLTRVWHVKRIRIHIPLLNRFAVSCAVCLQRALTVIKEWLLLPFLLKKKFIKLYFCT